MNYAFTGLEHRVEPTKEVRKDMDFTIDGFWRHSREPVNMLVLMRDSVVQQYKRYEEGGYAMDSYRQKIRDIQDYVREFI